MITLAFGMMVWALAMKLREMTGGEDGLGGIPRAILFIHSLNMEPMENYYYFVLIISLTAMFLFHRLVNSPLGLTFRGIRDSESRIACTGISIRNTRLLCFTIAGMYAGLAGALMAPLETRVTPVCAHWAASAEPVAATIIGGMYTFGGPLAGAAIFFLLKDIIVRFTEYWSLILGVIVIILVLTFRAQGLAGVLQQGLFSRFRLNFEGNRNERSDIKQ
jgi:branched-chain amino acid transport system permease protein